MTVPPLFPDLTPEEWDAVAAAQGSHRLLPKALRRKLRPFKKLLDGARKHLIAGLKPVLPMSSGQLRAAVHFLIVQQEATLTAQFRSASPSPTPYAAAWHGMEGDIWPVRVMFDRATQSFWFFNVEKNYLHGFNTGYHATELPTLIWTGKITNLPWVALDLIDDAVVRGVVKCAHGLAGLRAETLMAGRDFRLLDFIPYECAVEIDHAPQRFLIHPETEAWVERKSGSG